MCLFDSVGLNDLLVSVICTLICRLHLRIILYFYAVDRQFSMPIIEIHIDNTDYVFCKI